MKSILKIPTVLRSHKAREILHRKAAIRKEKHRFHLQDKIISQAINQREVGSKQGSHCYILHAVLFFLVSSKPRLTFSGLHGVISQNFRCENFKSYELKRCHLWRKMIRSDTGRATDKELLRRLLYKNESAWFTQLKLCAIILILPTDHLNLT